MIGGRLQANSEEDEDGKRILSLIGRLILMPFFTDEALFSELALAFEDVVLSGVIPWDSCCKSRSRFKDTVLISFSGL